MKTFVVTLAGLIFASSSLQAQEAKIIKAAGRKAIILLPEGEQARVGDVVTLGGGGARTLAGSSSGSGWGSGGSGSREHSIGLSGSFSSTSTTSSAANSLKTSKTSMSLSGLYGWNKGSMEYGPKFSFSNTSDNNGTTTTDSSSLLGGGFFDYNLVENKPGNDLLYGAGATALFGTGKSGNNSTTDMNFFFSGFFKWFTLGNSTALRADAGLVYNRQSLSDVTLTTMGFKVEGGLLVYF